MARLVTELGQKIYDRWMWVAVRGTRWDTNHQISPGVRMPFRVSAGRNSHAGTQMSKHLIIVTTTLFASVALAVSDPSNPQQIILRAHGVPSGAGIDIQNMMNLEIVNAFEQAFPHIKPVSSAGLAIPGRTMDVMPLMQIAGDIAPDTLYVNFRQSDTYVRSKFLYPLERFIESIAGTHIAGGHLMELDEYLRKLQQGTLYAREVKERVPRQCWQVMRRTCPYKIQCPYLEKWSEAPAERHYHTWCYPIGPLVKALFYRWDYLNEIGLPDRAPETMEELLQWSRKLHNPKKERFGLMLSHAELGWSTLSFLYSMEALLVDQDPQGNWHNVFDSEEAVDTYYYVARLFSEPYQNKHGEFDTSIYLKPAVPVMDNDKYAMFFGPLDQRFFGIYDPAKWHFGPVPKGYTGKRGSEFNSQMLGIYAGLADDEARLEAAWQYIQFIDGHEARNIRTRFMVEKGFGHYVRPSLLVAAGYPEYVRRVPPGWEETYQVALKHGVPEPYGKNCQLVYTYASKAIDQIRTDSTVRKAIRAGNESAAKVRIKEILSSAVKRSDRKMLNIFTPEEAKFRSRVASAAAVAIILIFIWVFRRVFKSFTASQQQITILVDQPKQGNWQITRVSLTGIRLRGNCLRTSDTPLTRMRSL